MITKIEDHGEQAQRLWLEQYQNKPRLRALLFSYIRRIQEFEDAGWEVILKRLIDNAEDAQLDVIGRIVGEPRLGKSDAEYRVFITARIRINRSNGRANDLLEVLRLIGLGTGGDAFEYREVYPAHIEIGFLNEARVDITVLAQLLRETRGAGVSLHLIEGTAPAPMGAATAFLLTSVMTGGNDLAHGLGSVTNASIGGDLSHARAAA